MKIWKKNMVAAAVLVTVCAGIYVNWLYMEDKAAASLVDTLDADKVMSEDTLILSEDMAAISAGEDVQTTATDYFAAVRLSRQQAREYLAHFWIKGTEWCFGLRADGKRMPGSGDAQHYQNIILSGILKFGEGFFHKRLVESSAEHLLPCTEDPETLGFH